LLLLLCSTTRDREWSQCGQDPTSAVVVLVRRRCAASASATLSRSTLSSSMHSSI
jgi:hypothetical protein